MERSRSYMLFRFFLSTLALLLMAGCQPKVYLMPSPVGIEAGGTFFDLSENSKDENRLMTLYATNRLPNKLSFEKDSYTIFPSDDLHLGFVVHRVGEEGISWEELYAMSLSRIREKELMISLEHVEEELSVEVEKRNYDLTEKQKIFIDRINSRLRSSADKDITVYVHGANSNFYRATAQGAQYYHYTGHNSVVLTFSWPSAENMFRYKVDVLHAKKTVPAFARLLELLGKNTVARNINIIGYSAGAQVVAPGLVYFRQMHGNLDADEFRERFRLGEVYFAAPDVEFKTFFDRYELFKDIVTRTTISSNMNDSVLRFANLHHGKSRLGRPKADELSEQQWQRIISLSTTDRLDLLDIAGSKALKAGKSHSFWYSHPWVSTDLLLLMLFNLPVDSRGLIKKDHTSGLQLHRFPDDYTHRIDDIRDGLKDHEK